jgi:hypothetical protein
MTIVSFLCTRVQNPTDEDFKKLLHLLGYLKNTRYKILVLKANKILRIEAYIDAAFALHFDSKSHTGIVIFIGGALVYAASRKQKQVCNKESYRE